MTASCSTEGCDRVVRAKKLCGPCYNRSRREAGIEKSPAWDDRRRDRYHRRRAAKAGSQATDRPVKLADIAERDKHRCHVCRKKVPSKAWPHPLSPSLDHVVPLVGGGEHTPENVRLAHLRCNISRGARGGGEQLLLIG